MHDLVEGWLWQGQVVCFAIRKQAFFRLVFLLCGCPLHYMEPHSSHCLEGRVHAWTDGWMDGWMGGFRGGGKHKDRQRWGESKSHQASCAPTRGPAIGTPSRTALRIIAGRLSDGSGMSALSSGPRSGESHLCTHPLRAQHGVAEKSMPTTRVTPLHAPDVSP